MTRERVTTLSALLLVIAKIEIEERIKIGREVISKQCPSREDNHDGLVFRLRATYSPAFPSRTDHDSGSLGFRSLHGYGAAGAFNPSSANPRAFAFYL